MITSVRVSSSCQYEKPTEESIGITLDDAKKLVQEKVDKMGLYFVALRSRQHTTETRISGFTYYSRTIFPSLSPWRQEAHWRI